MENNLGNKQIMARNIKRYMDKYEYTRRDLSDLLRVPYSTVSEWLHARAYPRIDKIEKMANIFCCTKADLVEDSVPVPNTFITYPVIVGIKAGYNGEVIFEESGESEQIPIDWIKGDTPNNFFIASVRGDSMHPLLIDGDRVLVHVTPSVSSGQIAVIRYNGDDMTIKRVVYKPNGDYFDLIPINTNYPTKRIQGYSLTEAGVIGEVKKVIRNL